jgi:hypothetical protein
MVQGGCKMSLELVKESIRVNRVIGEETTQTIVENDIIVPDTKPDILRVLFVDGEVFITGTEVHQDRIIANGTTHFKILYISDEEGQRLKSIDANAAFSQGLDIINARQGMHCRVDCDMEHIDHEIINARKINIKAIINIKGKVVNELEQQVVHDISGVRGVQILRDRYTVNSSIGSNDAAVSISESMDIPLGKPTVREILRSDAKFAEKEYKITDDRVVAKGELNVSTLYIADDETESIQFMEHSIPFMQVINIPGINEDMSLNVEYSLGDYRSHMEEDSDGELRMLRVEADLNIWAEGFYRSDIEAVADAYSPDSILVMERESFMVEEVAASSVSQAILKETLEIDDDRPEMAEVFNVLCRPVLSAHEVEKDRVLIEGVAASKVLYIANNEEQPVFLCERELPLKEIIEVKGVEPGMKCAISLDVDHVSYNMISSRNVEVRIVIGMDIKVYKQVSIPLVSRINETPLDEAEQKSKPSITIYFTQPGDTLWKVAKKYHIAVDEVRKANNIEEADEIVIGLQIFIPRTRD